MQSVQVTIRISKDLDKRIRSYCNIKKIESLSEFFRHAAVKEITPDTSDELLVFESLKDLHNKMHRTESELSVFFSMFLFFIKHFLVYNPEIPTEQIQAAALSAKKRYEEMFKEFQKTLENTPSIFQSMLADFYQDKEDVNG